MKRVSVIISEQSFELLKQIKERMGFKNLSMATELSIKVTNMNYLPLTK